MSNDLYIKFLMRKLIEYLNKGQKEKANKLIQEIMKELDSGDSTQMTKPPQCMPDEYKTEDYVQSYRNYYVGDKKRFARYTNRTTPEFMQ